MLKGYVGCWKAREGRPGEGTSVEYWFTSRSENAAYWETKELAENDCVLMERHQILIPSSQGGHYICRGFKVEERTQGEFVLLCLAPFISGS